MWAVFRHECITFDPRTGELELLGLVGADKLDPGNYRSSEYAIFPILSYVAGEYGDEKVRRGAIAKMKKGFGKVKTETGATVLDREKTSLATALGAVRGSLLRMEDWKNLIGEVCSYLKNTLMSCYIF
jgi:hypothetical protein